VSRRARLEGSRLLPASGFAGALMVFVAYLSYIARYGVNIAYWDDWHMVKLNEDLRAGTLHFSQVWAQHNAHRILVPNVVGLVLGTVFHFDVKLEMYVGAFLLALAVAFIVGGHRSLTSRPLYQYSPLVALVFTPVQWQNTLWGFQVAWFLVLAAFAGAAYALCRFRSRLGLAIAIAFAVTASFSSLQGLFTWPALALLLWSGRRSRAMKITWAAAGVASGIIYFYNFNFHQTGGSAFPSLSAIPSRPRSFSSSRLVHSHSGWVVLQ
jgi:hypothetical protein